MYHFDYNEEHNIESGVAPLILDISMIALAEKYLVQPLVALAREKFTARVFTEWDSDAFAQAIGEIYTSENGSVAAMKSVMIDTVQQHAQELFTDDKYASFQHMVKDAGDFLFDFSKANAATTAAKRNKDFARNDVTWYKCPGWACSRNVSIFAISNTVAKSLRFSCPLRCSVEQDQDFWRGHVVPKENLWGG